MNDTPLIIRPATGSDRLMVDGLFDRLDVRQRRFRFLDRPGEAGPDRVVPEPSIDHAASDDFVVIKGTELIASGKLAYDALRKHAEVAIAVRADLHNRGIGWFLLKRLCGRASLNGANVIRTIARKSDHLRALSLHRSDFRYADYASDPDLLVVTNRRIASARG